MEYVMYKQEAIGLGLLLAKWKLNESGHINKCP